MTKCRLVDQELLPRHTSGVDWGCRRKVIVRKGSLYLVWHPGTMMWAGIGCGQQWTGASLELHKAGPNDLNHRTLFDTRYERNGMKPATRPLSKKLLRETVPDVMFGVNVAEHWERGKTLVIEDA